MAKKGTKEVKQPTRKQIAYRKQDQTKERRLLIGAVIIVALIVLVLIFGAVQVFLIQPQSPIATVNGVSISTQDYQKLYRFQNYQLERSLQQLQQQQSLYADDEEQKFMYDYLQQNIDQMLTRQQTLSQDVLSEMIDNELVRQEVERRGITITPEELQTQIEKEFGYDRNPPTPTSTPTLTATQVITLTPTPTLPPMTEDQFKQAYNSSVGQFAQVAEYNENDIRQMFRTDLLRQKLQEKLEAEVPTKAEQIHASHILVQAEQLTPEADQTPTPEEQIKAQQEADAKARAEAEEILKRVTEGGEDFATVAKETSDDPGSKEEGGDLGWHTRGELVAEFENAAFSLQAGQIYTTVVKSPFGYHIIKLEDYDPDRELEELALNRRQSTALQDWLTEQQDKAKIERFWSLDKVPTIAPARVPVAP